MSSGRREYDSSPPAVALEEPEAEAGVQPVSVAGSRRRPRLRSVALNGLFVLACIYTLRVAREFFLPLALGLVLYFVLLPAVRALRRLHIPESVGAGLILSALMVGLALGAYALSWPAATWMARAPESLRQVETRLRPLAQRVARLSRTADEMEKMTIGGAAAATEVHVKQPGFSALVFGGMQSLLGGTVIVLTLVYFLLGSGDLFLRKIVQALPRLNDRKRAVEIAREMEKQISSYLFYTTFLNVVFGAAVGLVLWAMGMPNPALWAVVAAVTKYVPYLGGLVCTVVLGLAALLAFEDPWRALMVPTVFLVADTLHGNFILPALMGKRFTLNTSVLFVGLLFWFYLWGVAGALLAVPMMVALRIVCERVEGLRRIALFLGEDEEAARPAVN
jgi:predicted PurR-regulated permease PerM